MVARYVIFKDDDAGKDFNRLKKWVDIILDNDAKGSIGLIGKYMKNKQLKNFLNSLDPKKIEIFCHGYFHTIRKNFGKSRFIKAEFEKSFQDQNKGLKKYRELESTYLKNKAITFGPPGNIWNDNTSKALVENGFKLMFTGKKVSLDLFTIFLNSNFKQTSLDEFIKDYDKNKNETLFVLQFHHADLSNKQFKVFAEVIDFLKNKEKRIFVTPAEFFKISKNGDL